MTVKGPIRLLLILLVALCSCSQKEEPSGYFFLLQASSGEVVRGGEGVRLILHDVYEHVVYFTKPPKREAGFTPTGAFMDRWIDSHDQGFHDKHPSVDLVAVVSVASVAHGAKSERELIYTIVVDHPSYDPLSHTLSLDVEESLRGGALESGGIEDVTLFINGEQMGYSLW